MSEIYLSVVIPVYNEAESLKPLSEKLNSVLVKLQRSFEVIFIDDGSTDKSLEILEEISARHSNFKVISFKRNFGQTAAIAAGIDAAAGQVIVPLDADLENDPQDIPKLLEKLNQGYDIVSGWRKSRWSKNLFTRRLTSRIANWLISKVSGVKLHDYGCTLKAYQQQIIKGVQLYGEMHRFIPALAAWQEAKVTEIEVNYQPRQYGQSKYGLERVIKVLLDLIVLKFLNDYSLKPIYFFGKIGFVSFGLGILTFLWATYYKVTGQKDYIQTPLPVIMVLFVVIGIVLILIGLLAEMMMRIHHESTQRKVYLIKRKINF
jgi:glycosyltransferase involved in cell wall biosynthesis